MKGDLIDREHCFFCPKYTKDKSFLDDIMPWSDAYHDYEAKEKQAATGFFADQCSLERPRTPRKKDSCD